MRLGLPPEQWRANFDAAMSNVLANSDLPGIANLIAVLILTLDGQGRVGEVAGHLRYAESIAGDDADARTLLASIRASYATTNLEFDDARAALADAERWRPSATSQRAIAEYLGSCAVARCVMLDDAGDRLLLDAIAELSAMPYDGMLMLAQSWIVPRLVAAGRWTEAQPFIDALRASARNASQRWRAADADYFEMALAVPRVTDFATSEPRRFLSPPNRFAAWRSGMLDLYWCTVLDDREQGLRTVAQMDSMLDRMDPGLREAWDVARLIADVRDDEPTRSFPLPREISLTNLPVVLAAMNVVALSGTQFAASQWLTWAGRALPAWATTDLSWPVAVDRVRGLLAIRAGSIRNGLTLLRSGVAWAKSAGYSTESAIGALQLAEITAQVDKTAPIARVRAMRGKARESLDRAGVPWLPHAYAATTVATAGERIAHRQEALSAQESTVIGMVAEGLTNPEVAARLGLSDRTVQTYMRRIFEKFEVGTRTAAVREARERGIIE